METMKMMTRATWKLVPLLVQSRIQTVKALHQKQDHRKIMPVTRQHLNKSTRKSKQTTTKVDVELAVMKIVGEGLKTMCSSMQQQPQAGKEEKDEDDLFGVFVASQLKCMDQSRRAKAKYHINKIGRAHV